MPLIEGESLRAKLAREGELPINETMRILCDVADALAYAHEHRVVHRDIKPDNVLIARHHAVVTDFGVAKALSESTGKTSLTSAGVALGTPAYMAPEQAAADPHTNHRADIYAFGVMAYEMLAGRPPFHGRTPQKLLAAQMGEQPQPITELRPDTPALLAELVMRCLAHDARRCLCRRSPDRGRHRLHDSPGPRCRPDRLAPRQGYDQQERAHPRRGLSERRRRQHARADRDGSVSHGAGSVAERRGHAID